MENNYLVVAVSRACPYRKKGYRVHGGNALAKRLEKLTADGWKICEIRPYRKSWVNV